jgi:hypothetical protein
VSTRSRTTAPLRTAAAAALAGAVLLTGCGVDGTAKADPLPSSVCARILPADRVAKLLPQNTPISVREEQKPIEKYPLLRCEVTAGGVSFIGSAYLRNMAGPELVQLAGSTNSLATPLGNSGMVGPDDAWVVMEGCHLTIDGEPKTQPVLVRTKLVGSPNADHRDELAALTVELARGVDKAAKCEVPAADLPESPPGPLPAAPTPVPVTDAPICNVLDPRTLGPMAEGALRARWTATETPTPTNRYAYVHTCDLYIDGVRAFSMTVAFGYVGPLAELPGDRPRLSQRLPVPPAGTPQPTRGARDTTAMAPGTVIAAVEGTDPRNGPSNYRMSRHDGPNLPAAALSVPTEQVFRAFVDALVRQQRAAPPGPDAKWTFG